MPKFHSIRDKLMVSTFLLILLCGLVVIYLCGRQMEDLFLRYLSMPGTMHGGTMHGGMMHGGMMGGGMGMMGPSELAFMESYHQSLWWVGLFFAFLGLVVSYFLAGSITRPLRQLCQATEKIRQGKLKQEVPVTTCDEVGQLTTLFNKMSEELAENEQNRREFLANIAHELRTPLAVLQGQLESLLDGVEPPSPEKLFSMEEEVMRLTRLVADLRDLSLAEVHQLELHKKPVDLNGLLQRAAAMLTPLLEEKHLQFQVDLAEQLPLLELDPDRLNQVVYNLVVNAIRYTDPGTVITLTSRVQNGQVQLLVADQGPGIAPEDLPHIFEHFYRGDKSRNRGTGGSGIGLSLAKSFVENQGGTLTVANTQPKGAVFQVTFPIEKQKK